MNRGDEKGTERGRRGGLSTTAWRRRTCGRELKWREAGMQDHHLLCGRSCRQIPLLDATPAHALHSRSRSHSHQLLSPHTRPHKAKTSTLAPADAPPLSSPNQSPRASAPAFQLRAHPVAVESASLGRREERAGLWHWHPGAAWSPCSRTSNCLSRRPPPLLLLLLLRRRRRRRPISNLPGASSD